VATYRDRIEAGRVLAGALAHLRGAHPLVLGIPRGGVPVAAEIAEALDGELGCVLAAKVGAPWSSELAIGAVAHDGVPLLDDDMVRRLGLSDEEVAAEVARAVEEMGRRRSVFGADELEVSGRSVVVVDDGVATGATLRAALGYVRRRDPLRLTCAVPVGPPATIDLLALEVDEVVCPLQPARLRSVGEWYEVFGQTADAEVLDLLGR